MTLYRDIAIAIAFGRTDAPPQPKRERTAEEIEADIRAEIYREREEDEHLRSHFLRKDSRPEDYCDSVHEVVLRPNEVLAAQHAMALHLTSSRERMVAEKADYVTVRADEFGGALVSFLKRKPTPAQATDDNAARRNTRD